MFGIFCSYALLKIKAKQYFAQLICQHPNQHGIRQPYLPVPFFTAEPGIILQQQESCMAELGADRILLIFLWLGRTYLDIADDTFING